MFDDESLLVYPSVLFFQVVDGAIYDYRLVPLQRKDIWDSFRAGQELFASLAKVLNGVAPEYYGNRKEIFNLIKDELLTQKYILYILQGPKKRSEIRGILKNLLGLVRRLGWVCGSTRA